MLFDWLTTHYVVEVNPARSVRGPKRSVVEGATPAFEPKQARHLLDSIDTTTIAGLRDRAIIATLTYTAARVGAILNLKVKRVSGPPDCPRTCAVTLSGPRRPQT